MLFTAHQIRTKAAGDPATDYTDILLDTPWIGFNMLPGQTWSDIKVMMNTTVLPDGTRVKDYWDKPDFPFRIFKSHFTPEVLPIRRYPKVKFLAMARNGMDLSVKLSRMVKHGCSPFPCPPLVDSSPPRGGTRWMGTSGGPWDFSGASGGPR